MLNRMYGEGESVGKPANLGSPGRMVTKPVCVHFHSSTAFFKCNFSRGRKRLDKLSDFKTTTGYVGVKTAVEDRSLRSAEMMEAKNLLFYSSRKPEEEEESFIHTVVNL